MEKAIKQKESKLKIPVYNMLGEVVKDLSLSESIFSVKSSLALMAQYVNVYSTNQRQGNASAKTRAEVKGTTKKVYKQKGTGRARHGSMKAPIFKGGGVVGGPLPKDYSLKMNKKQKRIALFSSLTTQFNNKNIIGLIDESLKMKVKTNTVFQFLKKVSKPGDKILIISHKIENNNLVLSLRNIPNVFASSAQNINPYMVLTSNKIIFLEKALTDLESLIVPKK